ncbi:MAG: heat-shock protein [Campylobacter concisus]|uniref:Heat-shock protein n=1 Tax=Campylobacter concisus TaxID=199 RepID=A0A943Q1D5_9BACT|nr:heat-shock protein [Campylobacter concisus]MBS5829446.1 heat-shock protein [Campylobacter concisus]
MDQIKLENFRKEYGFDMPIVRSLSAGECIKIRENLLRKFSLNDIDEFFKIDKFSRLDGFNADEENFDLKAVFNKLGIAMPNEICINFNKFESIDILRFDDLFKFFSDIWYPSLDDIEIFDINLNWIISVRHYGDIYYFLTKK